MRGSAINLFQIYARTLGNSVTMPKGKSSAKQATTKSKTTKAVQQTGDPVYTTNNGAIVIRIRATPGARESRITGESKKKITFCIGEEEIGSVTYHPLRWESK